MTDTKCSYMKLVTENYEEINNSKINYCIYCYGIERNLKESITYIHNIYWINDKNGFTAVCTKCSIDAVIPGNYFINKNNNEICNQLDNWYKEGFTS
jgi:hypothetical protein